ncbi:glycosyl hydrolase family 18 protein, partial [Planctopirus hydrillae]|uniref:glycosyl hydrolase family 18 protein n=1 Tax=Planctopirus hydrillae TaxID=1841610 RepID=UPI000B03B066
AYVRFVSTLKQKFAEANLELSVDVEASAPSSAIPELASAADYLVVMAYDEHEESGSPGPIASIDFTERLLDKVLTSVSEDKVVLGVGSYAYDWTEGESPAESLSYQ